MRHFRDGLRRAGGWVAARDPRHVLVAGWLVAIAYAYPGLTTKDTLDQLAQARSHFYFDDHPPLMAAIWSVVDWVIAGPAGMLVLQTVPFVIGAFWVLRSVFRERTAAWLAVGLLLFPPVLAPMAVIWKDSLMAGCLLLGAGAFLGPPSRPRRILGFAALLVASAVRYNAPAATLPLLAGFAFIAPAAAIAPPLRARLRRYALVAGTWIAITYAALTLNGCLTDREMHFWHSSLAIQDLVGTLRYSSTTATDTTLRRTLAGTGLRIDHDIHAYARSHYRADDFLPLVFGPEAMFDLPLVNATQPASPATRTAITRAWRTIVLGRPLAYLHYRLDTFRVVLGFDDAAWSKVLVVTHPFQNREQLEKLGIPTGESWFQRRTSAVVVALSHTVLFRPYLYVVLALVVLALGRRDRTIATLVLSGLGLEASLFLLAGSPDFRYSHWMICCTVIATAMLVARRHAAGRLREDA